MSASVASVYEICEFGAWAVHTLLDDRNMLLSGGHLVQSVCEQYRDVCRATYFVCCELVWTVGIEGSKLSCLDLRGGQALAALV